MATTGLQTVPEGSADAPPAGAARRFRVLLLAEACNPEWVSVPLVGWSHARALARVADVHLVTQVRNEAMIRRAGLTDRDFTPIDNESLARPLYKLAERLGASGGRGWTIKTAAASLAYPRFEALAWRRFGGAIARGEYDVVHRLTPVSPALAGSLAAHCARARVPFVLGPINGGVPWPPAFKGLAHREREWLSRARGLHRLSPRFRSTRRHASAILVGSRRAWSEVPERHRDRCVYLPENAVDLSRFPPAARAGFDGPLRVVFVGRLVALKAVDVLIEAMAPMLKAGRATLAIVGDGPELGALKGMAADAGIEARVEFAGWLDHAAVRDRLGDAHVLGFPSVREFGGGAVLEGMAMGVVPVVADYGGPGELIDGASGIGVPLESREGLVAGVRGAIEALERDRSRLAAMSAAARRRVERCFTWDARAAQVIEVYRWVTGVARARPDFGMPLRSEA